ncbi:glycosyltransferase [Mesoterricola sediminis]|uniref:Glycosyltransferase subfamily 4-like N-terminal domain-containing protein n=1 Tax=Mesoterricola sediminis TaxID=2927980 RepID=A0AA48KEB2_9BACT|nr:glycosyltransferase [Mesoterricola sediminis]BDU75293.1 hypothetical protein METESE_02510 [Mesoterricola sediminis]
MSRETRPQGSKPILFLSSYTPSLVSGAGAKTAFFEALALHKAFGIHLNFFFTRYEDQFRKATEEACQDAGIHAVCPIPVGSVIPLFWVALFFWLPASYTRRFSLTTLFRLLRQTSSAIYVRDGQSLFIGLLLGKLKGVPVIASQSDVLVQMSGRSRQGARGIASRLFWGFEHLKLRFWEPRLLRSTSLCLVQSEKDAILLRQLAPGCKVAAFQPYLLGNLQFAPNPSTRPKVLFWGALNRKENEDAVLYFAECILPRILESVPDCQFVVAGISPSRRVMALEGDSIQVTGFLEDPAPVFNEAHVAVVPLRMGAGIKVKTVECMLMGLPTVATSVGAEGIEFQESQGLFVRETPEAIATAVVDLLRSGARQQAVRIRNQVLEAFSFERSAALIVDMTLKAMNT